MAFDLNAYFARIHFMGDYAPDLHTLRQLHLLQPCAIPFENLDVLLGRRILLDDESVFEKLVTAGRGGYCYEQNALLRRALLEIGFQVEDLAARVLIARPERMPARTHRLQLVTVAQERWLADVGFGGKTLTAPLRFVLDSEQTTPHGVYRLTRLEEDYLLSLREEDEWLPLYRFDLQRQYAVDFDVANHYVATWPESHFRHHLMLCLHVFGGSTITLNNRQLTVGGKKQELAGAAAVYQALQSRFGLRLDSPKHGIEVETFAAAFTLLNA
ncbi:arylamine N-acetyltransferase family protein [Cedecea colo]|uniref:N-hydroxyarylamine O-acetyltransferase n=1 Tax=Cedecea colo TaxID=2552946 RepID=A0ABX0VH03_9ENTR|nr:arylamine N-acetyltransferase [Cedecea colo]NIY46369.1 N-hydroxyarylamine O-acetyltransferase [Cedecea colo]